MTDAPGDAQDAPTEKTRRRRTNALIAALIAGGILVAAGLTAGGVTLFNAYAGQPPAAPGAAAPAATVPPVTVNTSGFPSGGANPGIFTDTCKHSLTAANDPILMPGTTGGSMQHDFFGNLAPTSSSTPATLVGGSTNCSTTADASAYWTPVLFQNGKALAPSATLIYWRAPAGNAASVKTMPAGISIVAGNEAASAAQSPRVAGWTCSAGKVATPMRLASAPVTCAAGHYLRLVVTFPTCWDGHTLDGGTQQNVVYAGAMNSCPASHPVQIPQIVVHINYPTSTADNLTLSVGPSQQGSLFTAHADFMNGWNQSAMDRNTAACIATQTRCGPVAGALATPRGPRT